MSRDVVIALIGAGGAVVASLIGAQWIFQKNVSGLSLSTTSVYEARKARTPYPAGDGGFVAVIVSAHAPELPMVSAWGKVGEDVVAGTVAQDGENQPVGSVSTTSFLMPVPKGATWIVDVPDGQEKAVSIKWVSFRTTLDRDL